MAQTSCKVRVDMLEPQNMEKATATFEGNGAYGDEALIWGDLNLSNHGILELNSFVLDGSIGMGVDDFKVLFFSANESNDLCEFANAPGIVLVSSEPIKNSIGIDFEFYEDYPDEVIVTWKKMVNGTYQTIESILGRPTSTHYFCKAVVENFTYCSIQFAKTYKPFQTIKVKSIKMGTVFNWQNDDISKGSVMEEVDTTGATLPINTSSISIIDSDGDFDVMNANGIWKFLKNDQEFVISEFVDDKEVAVGNFFLKNWNYQENETTFELQDRLGLMDSINFMGGMYSDKNAEQLLTEIFATANVTDFFIADTLKNVTLTGYLPICSCREALHQVAFSINAVVDASRGSTIRIYPPDRNVDSYIMVSRKFSGGTVAELDDYVSGITISCTTYTEKAATSEIFKGDLTKGVHKIEFSAPYTSVVATNATIISRGINYAYLNVANNAYVTLKGIGYDTNEFTVSKKTASVEEGQKSNIKAFSGITIYNTTLLQNIAERLLKWFGLRQKVSIEYLCDTEKVGEWVGIQDAANNSRYAITCINSQTIDLTGGFIASAECRGYSNETAVYSIMGNSELAMNGEELI